MRKLYSLAAVLVLLLAACNDDFLEKKPVTDLTEDNAFASYNNFAAFAYPLYAIFTDGNIATSPGAIGQNSHYRGDMNAGYLESKMPSAQNGFAYQTVSSVASGNGWDFSAYIRRANIMLDHIDAASMTDAEKDHWRAVAYFFHEFWYMELIARFGDVPWVDHQLNESSPELAQPRMPRKEVADKVLDRLKWAEEHIGNFEAKDGKNTVNQDVVRAAISRFALREATWRKYHELGDADKYFDECVRASELLMAKYPALYQGTDGQPAAGYGEMWTTEDLGKVPGVILYKEYVANIAPNNAGHYEHTSSHNVEMSQNTVDLYLMKNGRPIANAAAGYHGDKTMYATFRDRDPRLYHTVIPPYKVKSGGGEYKTWSFTGDAADREYMDIMGLNTSCSNPGVGMKRLPAQNWSASLVPEIPRLATGSFVSCRSGYYVWKNFNGWEQNFNNGSLNTSDKPIFKIEEVLLNWAEAKCEQGKFGQPEADKSINLLRRRASVDDMKVADIDDNFDPARPSYYPKGNDAGVKVPALLWEVRRERIVELMGEGFGFYDVRRWRMAPWFLNRPAKGLWMKKSDTTHGSFSLLNEQTGTADNTLTEGYVFLFNDPKTEGKGWLEKYYLYQVPTNEILLNPALEQNPGW